MTTLTMFVGWITLLAGSVGVASNAQPAASDAQVAGGGHTKFTTAQLDDYAAAFVELKQLRTIVAAQERVLSPEEKLRLSRATQDREHAIIARHDLDPASFNRISRAVEADPAVREKVKQLMMEDLLGT